MFQKNDINVKVFKMINIFHVVGNANLIVQYVVQIKNGIIKHVNLNVKIIASAKKIIDGIIAHVLVRITSI